MATVQTVIDEGAMRLLRLETAPFGTNSYLLV